MFVIYITAMLYGLIIVEIGLKIFIICILIISSYLYYLFTDLSLTNVIIERDRLIFIKPLRLFGIKRISIELESIDRVEIRIQSFGMITLYFKNEKYKTIGLNFGISTKRRFIFALRELFDHRVKVLGYYERDISDKY